MFYNKGSYDFSIKIDYSIYFEYEKQLSLLDAEIEVLSNEFFIFSENVDILESIVGIGRDLSLKLISFSNINNRDIKDVFADSRKWSAYFGTNLYLIGMFLEYFGGIFYLKLIFFKKNHCFDTHL